MSVEEIERYNVLADEIRKLESRIEALKVSIDGIPRYMATRMPTNDHLERNHDFTSDQLETIQRRMRALELQNAAKPMRKRNRSSR